MTLGGAAHARLHLVDLDSGYARRVADVHRDAILGFRLVTLLCSIRLIGFLPELATISLLLTHLSIFLKCFYFSIQITY